MGFEVCYTPVKLGICSMRKKNGIKKLTGKEIPKGRPAGSANQKSAFTRNEKFNHFRCSQGFNKTVDEIKNNNPAYKSKADVMHRALEILAARELPATFFWINKIQ